METKSEGKNNLSGLRIEQVSGSVDNVADGIHVEITTEESSQTIGGATSSTSSTGDIEEDDEDLPTLSSEQLARRPSFKRILDDLSSADATLKAAGTDPLALAAAATLQAQQAAALHQAAAGSLANHALIPGLLQGMQSLAAGITTASTPSSSTSNVPIPHQIMMQPLQQSLQLQSALLSAASNNPGPLIAGSVQSLAGQTSIPASILSNAINMAASLSNSSATNSILASSGHPSMLSVNTSSLTSSPGQPPLGGQAVPDEQGKKREIRLMKNRWEAHGSLLHDKKQLCIYIAYQEPQITLHPSKKFYKQHTYAHTQIYRTPGSRH
jgi:hypothetical protein